MKAAPRAVEFRGSVQPLTRRRRPAQAGEGPAVATGVSVVSSHIW